MASVNNYSSKIKSANYAYNAKQSANFNQQFNDKNNNSFLITQCEGNINYTNSDSGGESSGVDYFFNQKTPYNFPALIICDDPKQINQNADIYQNYSDIIYDECKNRYNIRNLKDSAGILQEGYSANIDLDSHLKNINFYNDKCFYDNWKMVPKIASPPCNGLQRNSKMLTPDYTSVGRNYGDSIGKCSNNVPLYNTPPTDIGCETDVKKRYDFTRNKFIEDTCIKSADRKTFKLAPSPAISNLDKYPDTRRAKELLQTINVGVKYDYYKFFENDKCIIYPSQRLFNNNTSRKAAPNHYNLHNIQPQYLS